MRNIRKSNIFGWVLIVVMLTISGFAIAFNSTVMAEGGKNRFGDELITEGFQVGCLDQLGNLLEGVTVTLTTCEEDDPGSCVMVVVDCSDFKD